MRGQQQQQQQQRRQSQDERARYVRWAARARPVSAVTAVGGTLGGWRQTTPGGAVVVTGSGV